MQVRYSNECQWVDANDEMVFQYVDSDGETLAEVALMDSDANLWKFEVKLPQRYQYNQTDPAGIVATQAGARKIAELILYSTIVNR